MQLIDLALEEGALLVAMPGAPSSVLVRPGAPSSVFVTRMFFKFCCLPFSGQYEEGHEEGPCTMELSLQCTVLCVWNCSNISSCNTDE